MFTHAVITEICCKKNHLMQDIRPQLNRWCSLNVIMMLLILHLVMHENVTPNKDICALFCSSTWPKTDFIV